jgi:hypothetical protein
MTCDLRLSSTRSGILNLPTYFRYLGSGCRDAPLCHLAISEDWKSEKGGCHGNLRGDPRGPSPLGPVLEDEVYEPVHLCTVGKESHEITPIVDAVDDRTRDAKCRCLRRTGVIKLKVFPVLGNETVYVSAVIGESTDDFTIVIAAEGRSTRLSHAVDFDIECREGVTQKAKEPVIVAIGVCPKSADVVLVSDVAGLGCNGTVKG